MIFTFFFADDTIKFDAGDEGEKEGSLGWDFIGKK